MLNQNPVMMVTENIQNGSGSLNKHKEWITVLVSVENPSTEVLNGLDRSARYELLNQNAQQRYEEIIAWINEREIMSEFRRIGTPTLFSTITMVCTPLGAQLVSSAPGVTRVVGAPEFVLNGRG